MWRWLTVFLLGAVLGAAFGVALGFFLFPFVFPPPEAKDQLTGPRRASSSPKASSSTPIRSTRSTTAKAA